jgi:flagellar hook protein FlgE
MTSFGWFQPSVLGMQGQSHAMQVIGSNIANLRTTAYKRSDTQFETVLGHTMAGADATPGSDGSLANHADVGGVRPVDLARISEAGAIATTGRPLDLAIAGDGFFTLATGGGDIVYGRDGGFVVGPGPLVTVTEPGGGSITVNSGYLVDRNGYSVLGWPTAADGSVAAAGAPAPMRVDDYAFVSDGRATAMATLAVNLPANDEAGAGVYGQRLQVFDAGARPRSLDVTFSRAPEANTWSFVVAGAPGDAVTVSPPADPLAPSGVGEDLRFDAMGRLLAPDSYSVSVAHADGGVSAFTLDLLGSTQIATDFLVADSGQDGYGPGTMQSFAIDAEGTVVGSFSNGETRPLYRLALADFANVDGLERQGGNVFAASDWSGAAVLGTAGSGGLGSVSAGGLEQSNVELEDEFSHMIMTQTAYNSSATAFRTMDEMLTTVRDLKR